MKKLKADSIQEIPNTTQSRIFCLQVCYKNIDIQIYRTIILSFYMGVKLGLSQDLCSSGLLHSE